MGPGTHHYSKTMEGNSGWAERRRHPRIERSDISARIFDSSRECGEASVTDVSLGGIGIYFPHRVQCGQFLRFQLQLPDGGSVSGVGVIRWAAPHHLGFRTGVEIRDIGWLGSWRLRRFLEPGDSAIDWFNVCDTALWAAAIVVGLVAVSSWLGINLLDLPKLLSPLDVR
ncbi:MAG TPA: hypothetical protein DD417_12385 [Elusimicrobia bacterium]|nr:hypothetical protein [Elusimicrobiota bacterium]